MFTSLYLVVVIKKISKFNFIIQEALQCKLRGFFVIEIYYSLLFFATACTKNKHSVQAKRNAYLSS